MKKLKIKQVVVVEGRYDKIKLDALIDGMIIPVHGFSIFTDAELKKLIKKLAEEYGIIILTDSDAAGFKIRGFIKGIVPAKYITDVYIPDILGKEKRKSRASKEGKLGVEGIDIDVLKAAFLKAGVSSTEREEREDEIKAYHLVELGLSGGKQSSKYRRKIYSYLEIPERISTSSALTILNKMFTLKEFMELVEKIKGE